MTRKDRALVAEYLREAGWRKRAIGAATAHAATEAEGVIPSRAEPSTVRETADTYSMGVIIYYIPSHRLLLLDFPSPVEIGRKIAAGMAA